MSKGFGAFNLNKDFDLNREFDLSRKFYRGFSSTEKETDQTTCDENTLSPEELHMKDEVRTSC